MEKVPGIVVYTPPRDVEDWECFYIGIHKDYKIKPLCVERIYLRIPDRLYCKESIIPSCTTSSGLSYPEKCYYTEMDNWGARQEEILKQNEDKPLIFADKESYLWELHNNYNGYLNRDKLKNLISVPLNTNGDVPASICNLPLLGKLKYIPRTGKTCYVITWTKYVMDDVLTMRVGWREEYIPSKVIYDCLDRNNITYTRKSNEKRSLFSSPDKRTEIQFTLYKMKRKSGNDIFDSIVHELKDYIIRKNRIEGSIVYI